VKILVGESNVLYKKSHGTHESSECPYPL